VLIVLLERGILLVSVFTFELLKSEMGFYCDCGFKEIVCKLLCVVILYKCAVFLQNHIGPANQDKMHGVHLHLILS